MSGKAVTIKILLAIVAVTFVWGLQSKANSPHESNSSQQVVGLSKRKINIATDKFVIVGAGAAGLAAVTSLINHGVSPGQITVIEKEATAGGKVKTIEVEGRYYDVGAVLLIPGYYKEIEELVLKYGVKTAPLQRGTFFNLATSTKDSAITAAEYPEFLAQVEKIKAYHKKWSDEGYSLLDPLGFTKIPPEVGNKTWQDFVKENKLEIVNRAFMSFLSGAAIEPGGASPPAAYVLRALQPALFDGLLGKNSQILIFPDQGFQSLLIKMAEDFEKQGVTFRYLSPVEKMTVSGEKTIIKYTQNNSSHVKTADQVIFAADPGLLPKLLTKTFDAVKKPFERIITNDQRSYVVEIDGLMEEGQNGSSGVLPHIAHSAIGKPIVLVKPYVDKNVYVVYVFGSPQLTEVEIKGSIKKELERFKGVSVKRFLSPEIRWNKFPHVSSDLEKYANNVVDTWGRGGLWVPGGESLSYSSVVETYRQTYGACAKILELGR